MLENSFPIFYIHHKLRSMSGMKMFTFMRIIEILNLIINKFNRDYDIQLVAILKQKKLKNKCLSFIILMISLCLNIMAFYSYIIALSIALNDSNNFIYPVFLKMSFIEMKKSAKAHKSKKVFEVIYNGNSSF